MNFAEFMRTLHEGTVNIHRINGMYVNKEIANRDITYDSMERYTVKAWWISTKNGGGAIVTVELEEA